MRKLVVLVLGACILSGCATYKFQRGEKPYDAGYVAARRGDAIPEYTLGKDNTVPDNLTLAQERFKRRRKTVEYYYKRMGYIENTFKETFVNPPKYMLQGVAGIFRLPFIARSDYRARHDPKYREWLMQRDMEKEAKEEVRVQSLKEALKAYIQNDLSLEEPAQPAAQAPVQPVAQPVAAVPEPAKEMTPVPPAPSSSKVTAVEQKMTTVAKSASVEPAAPVAVIIARPVKGNSPLLVNFSAGKSYAPRGKIVSYQWDFGDGDISYKAKAANTYYSVTLGPKTYTATLTVKNNMGKTAQATVNIEVLNK